MPPSCSASSAVVSVRPNHPFPTRHGLSKRRDKRERLGFHQREVESLTGHDTVYLFIGCVLLGSHWYNYIPGSLVALTGLVYVALEYVPSIEPPANMRYVTMRRSRFSRLRVEDADTVQGRRRWLGCRAGVRGWSISRSINCPSIAAVKARSMVVELLWKDQRRMCFQRGARSQGMSPATQCKKRIEDGDFGAVEERGYECHVDRMLVWIRRMRVRLVECMSCKQKNHDDTCSGMWYVDSTIGRKDKKMSQDPSSYT